MTAGSSPACPVIVLPSPSGLASTDAQRKLQDLVITAPEALASRLRGLRGAELLARAARLRIDHRLDSETLATATVLRRLALRVIELNAEAAEHKAAIKAIVGSLRPDLFTTAHRRPHPVRRDHPDYIERRRAEGKSDRKSSAA